MYNDAKPINDIREIGGQSMKQRETIYMAQKKSGRMLSQDIAKGMCMIFVVIFHIQVFLMMYCQRMYIVFLDCLRPI